MLTPMVTETRRLSPHGDTGAIVRISQGQAAPADRLSGSRREQSGPGQLSASGRSDQRAVS
jgi:hypothetical protein